MYAPAEQDNSKRNKWGGNERNKGEPYIGMQHDGQRQYERDAGLGPIHYARTEHHADGI